MGLGALETLETLEVSWSVEAFEAFEALGASDAFADMGPSLRILCMTGSLSSLSSC